MSRISRILNDPGKYLSLDNIIYNVIGGRLLLLWLRFSKWIPSDKIYIKVMYRFAMHEKLDLRNPRTYTQKVQWLKLNNTNPIYSKMVDKWEVKNIVAKELGEKYLIPLLGVWNNFDAIDFDKLPEQFVLKTTHDSGNVIICKDKTQFDIKKARRQLSRALKINYFYKSREYPYKQAVPRIIAERFMLDATQEELADYKFFCFNGEPKILQITTVQGKEKKVNYYDIDFNRLYLSTGPYATNNTFIKPDNYPEMVEIAKKISRDIIHVRIDLYNINGQIYFGEYTFHNSSGIVHFTPNEWNKILGDMIVLPINQ